MDILEAFGSAIMVVVGVLVAVWAAFMVMLPIYVRQMNKTLDKVCDHLAVIRRQGAQQAARHPGVYKAVTGSRPFDCE